MIQTFNEAVLPRIKQQVLDPLDEDKCPVCDCPWVSGRTDASCRLVGPGGYCHDSYTRQCEDCGITFTRHVRVRHGGKNVPVCVWYTDANGEVLAGVPGCFEPYVLNCRTCSGVVQREYRQLDSDAPITGGLGTIFKDGRAYPQYRTFYACSNGEWSVQVADEYYDWRQNDREID